MYIRMHALLSRLLPVLAASLIVFALGGCALPSLPFAAPTPAPAPTTIPPSTATRRPTPRPLSSATPRPTATLPPTATPRPTATLPPTATPRPVTVVPLEPTATLVPLALTEREAIFTRLWTLVRDNYLYEDYNGQNWAALHEEFAPRVRRAPDAEAFYSLMRELIDRLGDDHSRFLSPQEVAEEEARFEGDLVYGGIGAIVRDTEEGGLITSLAPGSPAELAGLRRFDLILMIDGVPFIDQEAFGPGGPISAVRGVPGSTVVLTIRSPGQPPREVSVVRQAVPRTAFPDVEATLLPGGQIGLVQIHTFNAEEVDRLVEREIRRLLERGPLEGLVVDVRSNGGGRVNLMLATVGLFVDGGSIGSTAGRSSRTEQRVPDGRTIAELEGLPVVVLTGPNTASAAEMFAAGLQARGRARVVGLASAGNTENLYPYSFDDGSRLWLAQVAYNLPDGSLIEGKGVIPDREVDGEWWRYDAPNDPQVVAAVEELRRAAVGP